MNESRGAIIEKIKKLLALSGNNPSKEEAIAAALKAQALIARHNVEEFELSDVDEQPVEIMSELGQHKTWRLRLARVVADNFRCKYFERVYPKQRNTVFFGYKMDAEAARHTFEYLYKVGNRLANRRAREIREVYGYADGVYNTFASGFIKGVREELEVQAEALMITVPPKVSEAFEKIEFSKKPRRVSYHRSRYFAYDAREDGYRAGKEAVRSGRIAAGDAHLLA